MEDKIEAFAETLVQTNYFRRLQDGHMLTSFTDRLAYFELNTQLEAVHLSHLST